MIPVSLLKDAESIQADFIRTALSESLVADLFTELCRSGLGTLRIDIDGPKLSVELVKRSQLQTLREPLQDCIEEMSLLVSEDPQLVGDTDSEAHSEETVRDSDAHSEETVRGAADVAVDGERSVRSSSVRTHDAPQLARRFW